MKEITTRLSALSSKLADEDFLNNKGLSNEVGIHVFCYEPKDEPEVMAYFSKLMSGDNGYNLVERDLYRIFLSICEEKRIIRAIPNMEKTKGKDYLLEQLRKVATPEEFAKRIAYEPHNKGDILLLTGLGKVYPFMRSHKILDNIQHIFSDIPVLMLYPGVFNGQELILFGEFLDGNYYRAFNLV